MQGGQLYLVNRIKFIFADKRNSETRLAVPLSHLNMGVFTHLRHQRLKDKKN